MSGVEEIINHFWLVILADEQARQQMGVRYLSHGWDKGPYWYIWLTQCRGVYKLELAEILAEGQGYDWQAEFDLKYYPHPDEEWFGGLSIFEKICRTSDVFHSHACQTCGCVLHEADSHHDGPKFADIQHQTGAPNYWGSQQIPADFFLAGIMSLAFKSGTGSLLRVKSQSRWRVIMAADYCLTDAHRQRWIVRKGEIDRNYAGQAIVQFFMERFVQGWKCFHGYRVQQETVWKGAGMEFISDGSSWQAAANPEIEKIVADYELRYDDQPLFAPADDDIGGMQIYSACLQAGQG